MGEVTEKLEPRIYIACLAAYNNGRLHGVWIDVEDDADTVRDAINAMLKASPMPGAEEYAIHDHEGFGGVEIAEYAGIDKVVEIAAFLRVYGGLGALVLEHFGDDLEAAQTALVEDYHGVFDSLADCIQEVTEEATVIPERLRYYIDWEAMGRDAELNGDIFTIKTAHDEVHVFWNR
ncbi:antirestriction protein ArdA [Caulobacter sp. DWR2-3-1b2]|uniref:antirestriction protein ArdA n=1 Tax=unclassified Caulobacter TaxID=2648921 RepID=UPI003CEBAF51